MPPFILCAHANLLRFRRPGSAVWPEVPDRPNCLTALKCDVHDVVQYFLRDPIILQEDAEEAEGKAASRIQSFYRRQRRSRRWAEIGKAWNWESAAVKLRHMTS
jgi:hypothetical protein